MEEPGVRRRLEAIDSNIHLNDNAMADPASAPAAKKAKSIPHVFTFSVAHSPVQVQLLSTQTLYDLVDIICRETKIGRNESVNAHTWNIRLQGGRAYESGDFPCQSERRANRTQLADLALVPKTTTMILNYDYGAGWVYDIFSRKRLKMTTLPVVMSILSSSTSPCFLVANQRLCPRALPCTKLSKSI